MATLVATATGGNWSAAATWSPAQTPTAADDVQLASTSGQVTIDVASVCRSFDCTGYTNTLTPTSGLTIGDATAGLSNIALKFVSGMTVGSTVATITFVSTSVTVQTVDFAGKAVGSVTFNAASNGSWQYVGAQATTNVFAQLTLTKGTLDLNGQTVTTGIINSSNSNVRTFSWGASSITCTFGNGTAFDFGITTSLTFNPGTSILTLSGGGPLTMQGGSKTYASVSFTGGGVVNLVGANTFTNLTRTGSASKTDEFLPNSNQTITGTLTINGNSSINRMFVHSNGLGTARTLTASTVSMSNVDFQDITAAGAANWNLSAIGGNSGDAGGNSGITFTASSTQSWNFASGGNWSIQGNWSSRVPLPQDDANLAVAFAASQTVTADMPRLGKSINWTGTTGSPAWTITSTNFVYGSVTLVSNLTVNGAATLRLSGRSAFTLTSNGATYAINTIGLYAPGGTYTQQDNFTTTGTFDFNFGGWSMNNFNLTILSLTSNVTNARSLTGGTGTLSLTQTTATNIWNMNGTSFTMSMASATIAISNASAGTRTFGGASVGTTYGLLSYTVAGSTGALIIGSSNTFGTINFSDITNARTLTLTAGTTTTVTNFNVSGTPGKLMTINSSTGGSATTLSKASGTVSSDYLSIQDSTATGGATWYAGANSTNGTNNTGWIFTAPPSATSSTGLLLMGIG